MLRAAILLSLVTLLNALTGSSASSVNSFTGVVVSSSDRQPVPQARVRVQGSDVMALTGADGTFTLTTNLAPGTNALLTAGKLAWYNKLKVLSVNGPADTIFIDPIPVTDNEDYVFQDPIYCNTCHNTLYTQWTQSKHSKAATNPMLKQIYRGTDIYGNTGVAPGFKLDFPNEGGDCGDCHAPTAAMKSPGNTEMNDVWAHGGVDTNGVYCDFCHKINRVDVNYATGVNGSIFVQRPADQARDINVAQFDDVTSFWMGGTYNPIFEKSDYCSGCHQYANRNGLVVDDTYDSWYASDYRSEGIACQDCHMRPNSSTTFAGGIAGADVVPRDTNRIYNQRFRGGTDPSMLRASVSMALDTTFLKNTLEVRTRITNIGAGHKLPTGVSFRNMILLVTAVHGDDTLKFISGDTIAFYGGRGNKHTGHLSGQPGKGFTMLNKDAAGVVPAPNWMSTETISDNRIPAHATDTTRTRFRLVAGEVTIRAQLIYRAVYKEWADAKGWDMREFVMADTSFTITVDPSLVIPEVTSLYQNYPNPFNGTTQIRYDLNREDRVSIEIYNIMGQKVATLVDDRKSEGVHYAVWDSKDSRGNTVSSGVYLYRLRTGTSVKTKKLLLIK